MKFLGKIQVEEDSSAQHNEQPTDEQPALAKKGLVINIPPTAYYALIMLILIAFGLAGNCLSKK